MLDQSYYAKADEIIEHYGRKAGSLIPIMQDIQAVYRYLPGELLTYVAAEIGITEANLSILRSGKAKGVRFGTINKICYYLQCDVGDILHFDGVLEEDEEDE